LPPCGDGRLAYRGAIGNDRRIAGWPTVNYVEQALADLTAGKPVRMASTGLYGFSVKFKE
jgi:hypothetical protein